MEAGVGEVTIDTLLRGRVSFLQPAKGYRSSLDPVLLAGFLSPPYGRFLDVGCGSGVLSFLLCAADAAASGVAVEIQPRLAQLASMGRARNGLESRLEVVRADVRRLSLERATFDTVATNPPYRELTRGPVSPDAEKACANHEVSLALIEWVAVAAAVLRPAGRLGVVFPAERLGELAAALLGKGLQLSRLRLVHPRPDRPATRLLVEAVREGTVRRPLEVEPPLIVHEADGTYTFEVRRMLGEAPSPASPAAGG